MTIPLAAQYPVNNFGGNGVAAEIEVVPVAPTQEYVATGYIQAGINKQSARILSNNIDEIMQLIGPHTYEQMINTDAEISKCINVLKTYTLSDDIDVTPAVPQHDNNYNLAKQYSDFCNRAINNLDVRLCDVVEQLLDCLIYGHKVAEVTYDLKSDGQDKGKLLLKTIKVKPQRSIAFVVDQFNNVLGFKARNTVVNPTDSAMYFTPDRTSTGDVMVIPRDKFIVFTFKCKDSDPRGTSILRAVYNAWHLKMTMWPEYMRWLTNCAIPGLVGVAAPADQYEKQYVLNPDGTPHLDPAGNPIVIPATSALANALEQMKNASVIAVPNGASVQPINSNVSSEPFKTARDVLNEEIEMALLLQTLATTDSRNNTRAASQTALTVLDVLVYYLKSIVCDALQRDLIKRLLELNFANVNPELIPNVTLGDTERRSWAIDGVAAATMYASGFLQDSQKASIYDQLGIQAPAENDTGPNSAIEAKQAKVTQPMSDAKNVAKQKSNPTTPANVNQAGG